MFDLALKLGLARPAQFQRLKKVVADINVLSPFNHDLPLHLFCDASREGGLGFVLTQPASDRVNVLQCGSTSLSQAQRGYSIVELELLGIVWALEKCAYYTLSLIHI